MFLIILIPILVACILAPMIVFNLGPKTKKRFNLTLASNLIAFFGTLLIATIYIFTGDAFASGEAAEAVSSSTQGYMYIAAALSTGLGSIGAGIATGNAASSAIGAISENEAIFGKTLVFVGMAEGVAIYGLLVSLLILFF